VGTARLAAQASSPSLCVRPMGEHPIQHQTSGGEGQDCPPSPAGWGVVGRAAGPGSSSPLLLRILGKRMGPLPACWVILPQDTGSYMCKRVCVCVCARAHTRLCLTQPGPGTHSPVYPLRPEASKWSEGLRQGAQDLYQRLLLAWRGPGCNCLGTPGTGHGACGPQVY
jgi:hypothetical protein